MNQAIARVVLSTILLTGLQWSFGLQLTFAKKMIPALLCYVAASAIVAWYVALPVK